jgi:hypothetical protein
MSPWLALILRESLFKKKSSKEKGQYGENGCDQVRDQKGVCG